MSLGLGDKMVTTDGAGVIITKIRPLTKPEKIILRTTNGLVNVNGIQTTALCDKTPFESSDISAIEIDEYFTKYHERLIFQ
jgi:hypothetical protein